MKALLNRNQQYPIQQDPQYLANMTYLMVVPITANAVNVPISNQNFLDDKIILAIDFLPIKDTDGNAYLSKAPDGTANISVADAANGYLVIKDDNNNQIHQQIPLNALSSVLNAGQKFTFNPFNVKMSNSYLQFASGSAVTASDVMFLITYAIKDENMPMTPGQ